MNRPAECLLCLIESRIGDLVRLGAFSYEAASKLLSKISELIMRPRSEAFALSFKAVAEIIGCPDPYKRRKDELNSTEIHIQLDDPIDALRMATLGNLVDTSVRGFKFSGSLKEALVGDFSIDESNVLADANRIAIVLDNSGEYILDRALAEVLKKSGKEVTLIARGEPYEIDVTSSECPDCVSVSGSFSPLYLPAYGSEWVSFLESHDLIISKGIANLEAYVDSYSLGYKLETKLLFAFRAKCAVLSEILKVERGSAIIAGWETLVRRGILELADSSSFASSSVGL